MDVLNRSNRAKGCAPALPAGARPGGEFERALAHKLGNLLQVVNGNLELLAQRAVDERSRTYLANAQTAARELTEMAHALAEAASADS